MNHKTKHNFNKLKSMVGLKIGALVLTLMGVASAQAVEPVRDWNFLVFINGVNNLDSFGSLNINQMEQVGSNENLNILVQWGSMKFKTGKRLYVKKDSDLTKVTSPVVSEVAKPDFGDPNQLIDFAKWANENYPARHTFIVVWNHGNGWHKRNESEVYRDISYDDRTGSRITTEKLGEAMAKISENLGKKIDIYGSDACLMGMIEVASEMKNSVDYFVGSQDLEPGEGWPYHTFLGKWVKNPSLTPAEISQLLSKEYKAAYDGGVYGNQSVTMSALDLAEVTRFEDAIADFTKELKSVKPEQMANIKKAYTSTKYFYLSDYRDAFNFLQNLETNSIAMQSAQTVKNAHSKLVISNDQNQDKKTFGLSIWIPEKSNYNQYSARYQNLAFTKATKWNEFLATFAK